jgi:hypothetical protein
MSTLADIQEAIQTGQLTGVIVEVTFPETEFGGVLVQMPAEIPIQVVLGTGTSVGSPDTPSGGGITASGSTSLVAGQAFIDVVFQAAQASDEWNLLECHVVNTIDPSPLNIWAGILTSKSATGFRVQLNGLPNTGNYALHWAIA